jgi:PAS domain S-box-containing protein
MLQDDQYSILSQFSDCVLILDRDYTIVFANQSFCDLCATTHDEIMGKKCYEVLHHSPFPCTGENEPEHRCLHRQIFTTGLPFSGNRELTMLDGSKKFLQISASPLKDEKGMVVRLLSVIKDLTQEKKLQDALDTSIAEHEAIFQNVSFYLSFVDPEMLVIKLNPLMEELVGVKSDQAKGRHCYDIWGQYAQDPGKMGKEKICDVCKVQHTLIDGQTYRYEREISDGYVEVTTIPVKDKDGEIIGALECGVNITQRKNAEIALQRSETRYAALFNNNPNIMMLIDPQTACVLDANPAACAFYGYERQEWPGMKITDINPLAHEKILTKLNQILEKGKETFYFRHRLKNGKVRDVEVHCGALVIDNHQVLCATIIDITERLQAEKERARSKEEWEKTFNALNDIITIQDKKMRIIRANKAAYQFFQVNEKGLTGRYCYELFYGINSPCPDCPLSGTSNNQGGQSWIINHEKSGKIFQISSSPILDNNGEISYLVHIARDITAQRKMEENIFQAQKMEAIGTMAGGIAHDFNNILSAILGYSELVQRELLPGTSAHQDIHQVITAGKRASVLIQQILDFSRETEQKLQPLRPHLIIQETLQMLRSTLPVTVEIQENLDPACGIIMADPTKIHQVIMNLCTNAFHALPNEKGTLRIMLSRQERIVEDFNTNDGASASFIVLSVSDTGHGMDPETKSRIFEPYFTTKERGRGTGLGLAVVHGIIEGYNGVIEVESEPGQGCTFRIFIPALKEDNSTLEEQKIEATSLIGTERILVVDDEPLLVRINQRVLEDFGYSVTGMTDSREALEAIQTRPQQFDLLVTDQTMPGLTGSELAKAVLEIIPTLPIIICTGHSAIISEGEALALGIRKYLYKPIHGDELAKTVRMILDKQ